LAAVAASHFSPCDPQAQLFLSKSSSSPTVYAVPRNQIGDVCSAWFDARDSLLIAAQWYNDCSVWQFQDGLGLDIYEFYAIIDFSGSGVVASSG
jgi:hypothetical protein